MDAGRIPEVVMKELTPAKAQDAEDAEIDEIERTKGKQQQQSCSLTALCTLQMFI